MKERLKQLYFRKNFVSWFNTQALSQVISDECFQAFRNKFGVNRVFESESKESGVKKYILLSVTELPSPDLFKSIKQSDALILHRIRHYKKDGFSKTYRY